MERSLENREIPGITAKQLVWYMGGVISIIITVMMSYASIKASLSDNSKDLEALRKNSELRDTQVETLKLDIQTLKLDIQTIKFEVQALQQKMK